MAWNVSGWGFNWALEALVRAEGGCRQDAEGFVMVRGLCACVRTGAQAGLGLLTRRALLWYLTAFLVSDTALST